MPCAGITSEDDLGMAQRTLQPRLHCQELVTARQP